MSNVFTRNIVIRKLSLHHIRQWFEGHRNITLISLIKEFTWIVLLFIDTYIHTQRDRHIFLKAPFNPLNTNMTIGTLRYTFQYTHITVKLTRSKILKFITGYAYYFTTALWINFSRHLLRAETNYLRCHSVKAHNTSWGFTLVVSIVTFRDFSFGRLYSSSYRWKNQYGARLRKIMTKENRRSRSKACPRATYSTTNPTWMGLGLNPGFRSDSAATIRLNHGTALPWI